MLVYLVERSGHLVTKEELLEGLWPGLFVEESNLTQNVFLLRRALTNGANGHDYIETVPRRGYRFNVPVREAPVEPAAPERPSPSPVPVAPAPARPRRRLPILGAVLAVALAGWIWTIRHAPRPVVGVRSIAVLPLKMLGPPGVDEYLGLGLADAVTTRLGYVRRLLVRPTASVRGVDGNGDPVAAGRALRVDAVLAGQIQKADGRVRVTAQLIGVRDGGELWSETFDVKAGDLFVIEDSISEAVARALASSISAGEARQVGRDRPTSPNAYDAYLRGRYFWNQRSAPATRKARALFAEAIALDPDYALAYAGLADALRYFPDPDYDPQRSRALAERALELDDTLAEAHASLGNLSLFADWNFEAAERHFRRAVDLNPSYATAHQWYAYCFLVRGDLAGASLEIQKAREADPLSPSIAVDSGLMLYYGRRYEAAAAQQRRVLELDPGFLQAHQALAMALVKGGQGAAAIPECSPPAPIDREFVDSCVALASAYAGNRREAERRLAAVDRPGRWWTAAAVATALGDKDGAFAALEAGYVLHDAPLLLLEADPLFDDLRSDRRFADLVRRVGIQPVSR
jgi:TolB-like protein/Flp pilus assembly protein TadD